MALPGYMQLTGENQGQIEGESEATDREGWIVVQGFRHNVKLPTDQRGLPSGRRAHLPMTITKEVDRSSPMLYQALCDGELLKEVVIDWYRMDSAGMEELYYRTTLKNAQITGIEFWVPNALESGNREMGHMEDINIIYDQIIWSHEADGIEYEDTWGNE